jgi:hypothetical protein
MTWLLAQIEVPDIPDPVIVTQTGPQPPWESMPAEAFVLIVLAMTVGALLLLWPLVRALSRRLEGGSRKLEGEVASLRARVEAIEQQAITSGEFDASEHRMYELEERVEFVERLLARGKEGANGA